MSSGGSKNRRTREFTALFDKLPEEIQDLAKGAYDLFCRDPSHRSLRHHALDDTKKSHQKDGSYSVSITMNYRAIYVPVDGINIWYWIGTHAEYKKYTGSPR